MIPDLIKKVLLILTMDVGGRHLSKDTYLVNSPVIHSTQIYQIALPLRFAKKRHKKISSTYGRAINTLPPNPSSLLAIATFFGLQIFFLMPPPPSIMD